jgi:uncharacterized protein (DUF1800 family)
MKKMIAGRVRGAIALCCGFALFTPLFGGAVAQQKQRSTAALKEEQQIIHVLNRLGFGARPGDIERVKTIGIENYINQQLNPEKLSDAVTEAKLINLPTLTMTTAQLYEKYPQPGMLVRQLERRGELPAELAENRRNRPLQNQQAQPIPEDAMPRQPAPQNPAVPSTDAAANQEYRRAIRQYYAQNGLQLPQRIIGELQAARILRAVYSERQLQEVMVDFWTNHFNVFAGKGADRWLLVSYDRDTIRPNAMGRFSDLLVATAQSPAMLFYLDNFQSVSPDAQLGRRANQRRLMLGNVPGGRRRARLPNREMDRQQMSRPDGAPNPAPQRMRRGINENYARELMELHTLGVDGGYTQKDVQEVARCFTGWTIFAPRGAGALQARMGEVARERAGTFFFNPRAHDDGEKMVLGHKIPAGGGFKDGLMVLDILAKHPATAKFISQKLARYFVSDSPSPALVDRVAAAFTKSGGDIRETLRAIFFSAEFNSAEAYRSKVKRPFELAISAVRTLGGETNGGPQFHQWIARMGEPLYGFQTPNGYSDTAESWVNTGGLLERLNFGLALASNRIPGTRVDLKRFVHDADNDNREVMDRFLDVIIAGDISAKTKETLLKQLAEPATSDVSRTAPPVTDLNRELAVRPRGRDVARQADMNDPVSRIVGLILGSPEFQKQ